MRPHWRPLSFIVAAHAVGGWVFGAITAADSIMEMGGALLGVTALRGGVTALLVGLLWGWTLLFLGRRWYLGGLLALPGALAGVYLYFALWPVEGWEMPTWKAAGVVLSSYWEFLIPITLLVGTLAAGGVTHLRAEGTDG